MICWLAYKATNDASRQGRIKLLGGGPCAKCKRGPPAPSLPSLYHTPRVLPFKAGIFGLRVCPQLLHADDNDFLNGFVGM